MRHIVVLIFFFSFVSGVIAQQDTLVRRFSATVKFSTSTVQGSGYRCELSLNDQTNTYIGTDVAVDDIVIESINASVFRIDTIYSSTRSIVDVFLTELTDLGRLPSGVGQIERRTPNFELSLLTPSNAQGISPQLLSVISSSNIMKIDSLLSVISDSSLVALIRSGNVTIDGNNNSIDLDSLSDFNVQTNNFDITNIGGFSMLRTVNGPTQRIIEVNQSTLRLTGGATESNSVKTQVALADADNDMQLVSFQGTRDFLEVTRIKRGNYSGSTNASGEVTIGHGFTNPLATPASVQITGITDADRTYVVTSADNNFFTVKVYEGGSVLATSAVNFYWTAFE